MAEMIHQLPDLVRAPDGVSYVVQVWGENDERWHGWLVFIAADGSILRTGREMSKVSRAALLVWAMKLGRAQVKRALGRAFAPSAERPAA